MKPVCLKATYYRSSSSTGLLEPPALFGYARITGSQSTDLLETPAPLGGMPEPLAPNKVTSINGMVGFSKLVNSCPQLSSQQPGLADTGWYYQPPEVLREMSFQKEAPYWRTPLYSFSPLKGYIQRVTVVLRLAGTTSSLLWYAKTIGSQSTGLLEPLAPYGGMSEPLAPREVASISSKGRFFTTGEPLSPVLSCPRLADTVSSLRWYAKTVGSLLRRISLQM
jgi:hypothetical protein